MKKMTNDDTLKTATWKCTLWRRGSTEANVRRHNVFYATPPETLHTNQRLGEHGASLGKLRFNVLFVLSTAESRSIITDFTDFPELSSRLSSYRFTSVFLCVVFSFLFSSVFVLCQLSFSFNVRFCVGLGYHFSF